MASEPTVEIAPAFHGHRGLLDFISPEGTLIFQIGYDTFQPGLLFRVNANGYEFSLSFSEDAVHVRRNSQSLRVALAAARLRSGRLIVAVVWSPSELRLKLQDAAWFWQDVCETAPPCFPPFSLREWARKQGMIPTVDYDTAELLFQAVVTQLELLRAKIIDTGAIAGFWDTQYEGARIVTRTPKRETEVHQQIRLLLYDLELSAGLQVIPEYSTGTGAVDFLVTGRTKADETVNVCVEFKHVHSPDLAHGFMVQLPQYMKRRATDYGLYCLLDFGPEYPPDLSKIELPNLDTTGMTLNELLPLMPFAIGARFLRSVVFDLSKRPSPSKL